ncbi:unnamed protein product [Prorocentrum cordatum]|uniref:Uncharacterized protein n=1 Tax=Prorocentrum cordatum TaxID=2364126 RepID=A0ABN9TYL5_9DINO|nr:unnamed protein product [Polarella glacialis]
MGACKRVPTCPHTQLVTAIHSWRGLGAPRVPAGAASSTPERGRGDAIRVCLGCRGEKARRTPPSLFNMRRPKISAVVTGPQYPRIERAAPAATQRAGCDRSGCYSGAPKRAAPAATGQVATVVHHVSLDV